MRPTTLLPFYSLTEFVKYVTQIFIPSIKNIKYLTAQRIFFMNPRTDTFSHVLDRLNKILLNGSNILSKTF